jgi:prolipoprotein diacylglyceryltransferase
VFLLLGWSGFALAVVLVLALTAATGRSVAVQAAISLLAIGVYAAVARLARRVLGRAALVYYHHVLAFLALAGALAAVLGAPVLAHLDITACGLAAFTAVARAGCLMTGCCHGRPARHGVLYGSEHVRLGLPAYLAGLPLVPVQAVESVVSAGLAIAGTIAVLGGAAPGTALVIFVVGYAVLRFGLEWLRGDLLRPYRRRLSEAQWTSVALTAGVAAAAAAGILPGAAVAVAAAALLIAAATLTVAGRAPGARTFLGPQHVRELAARLDRLPRSTLPAVRTARTSLGLRVSTGAAADAVHYTVSADRGPLDGAEAQQLARLLMWLRHAGAQAYLVPGQAGAIHVLTPAAPDRWDNRTGVPAAPS